MGPQPAYEQWRNRNKVWFWYSDVKFMAERDVLLYFSFGNMVRFRLWKCWKASDLFVTWRTWSGNFSYKVFLYCTFIAADEFDRIFMYLVSVGKQNH